MRKLLGCLLAMGVVLSALGAGPVLADPLKPVAVVSVASYDELMGDLQFVGKLADRPELATGVSGMLSLVTGGRGLEGMDKARPVAAVIQTDGQKFSGYGLVPVTDLKKLLAVVEPVVRKIVDKGDGVYEIQTDQGRNIYVKEKTRGWAAVCESQDALGNLPEDPAASLTKASEKYDLAVTVYVHNLPEKNRQDFLAQMRERAERQMQPLPGESEAENSVRKRLMERAVSSVAKVVEEIDQVALGVTVDHKAEKFSLDVSATALPGSQSAKDLASLANAKSAFAGLLLPGAAMTGNLAVKVSAEDVKDLAEAIEVLKPRAMEQIDRRARSAEEGKVQKEIVGSLLEATRKTIASGRSDGAMSVVMAPDAVTLLAGWYTADGPTVERMFRQIVDAARGANADFVNRVVKLDAGQVRGVNLHTASIPLPSEMRDREKAVRMVGETLEIVVGVGRESVYVAAGRDAMKTLREAIERSDTAAKVSPMKLSIALGPLFKFAAEVGESERERQMAAKAAEALEKMSGKDHLNLVAEPIERGIQVRFEAEPDVLKILGVLAKEQSLP